MMPRTPRPSFGSPGSGLIAAAVLVMAACGSPDGQVDGAADGDARSPVDADTSGAASRDGSGSTAAAPICLRGGPFVADGRIGVGDRTGEASSPGDPDRVSAVRWHRYDGCERLVVDLADRDGQAAGRPGDVRAAVIRDLGVVRVDLRDVQGVDPAATDAMFPGPLVRAAYTVSSPEGDRVYVDVHLGEPAEASISILDEPARVVVDIRPGGGPVPAPAPRSTRVVVLEPRPGEASYPLTVTGYARTFEANVVVRLEHDGREVHEDFTTATAWVDAWGHYSLTIPDGPRGAVVLHVGEHSARDGSWEGVVVPLEMR